MSNVGAETRRASALAVFSVLQGHGYEQALKEAGYHDLPLERQPLASELTLGALRWHHRHAVMLASLMDRPRAGSRLEALLSVGLYQLAHTRVPAHAAVSACVSAGKRLLKSGQAGVVNAVLRRYLRERVSVESEAEHSLEGTYSHPDWMIRRLQAAWPGHWQSVLKAGNRKPPLWLRVNRLKIARKSYRARLREAGIRRCSMPEELPDAVLVYPPRPTAQLPGFSEGLVSVQDAGAQIAVGMLDPKPGMRVLDACAAPGGKTGQLLEHCPGLGELVAVDVDGERLRRVGENLARLGLSATVRVGDVRRPSEWFDGGAFDRILLDAPCSSTGVIRRHPDIKHLRREDDILRYARLQAKLLRSLWPLLRPGGRLLYSVCSVLPEETTRVIGGFLSENRELVRVSKGLGSRSAGWSLPLAEHGYQLLPGRYCADGHFNALLEKAF